MLNYINKIYVLSGETSSKFFFIFFCYLISSFFDVMGIALVGSFATIVIKPDIFENKEILEKFLFLDMPIEEISLFLGLGIILIFIIKTFLIVFVYKQIINFSFNIQSSLRNKLMQSYLKMNYEDYTQSQTSKFIQMSGNMVKTYGSVLNAFLQTTGDLIIFLSISTFLIFVNYKIYLILVIFFILFFGIYKIIFLDKLKSIGEQLNKNYTSLYKNIRDFFNGFKEIKILNISNIFFSNVKNSSENIAGFDKKNAFITIMPKYLLELFFVTFIIIIFLIALRADVEDTVIISTSSFFVASIIRILPSLLQFVRLKSTFNLGENSVKVLFDEIMKIENKYKLDSNNHNKFISQYYDFQKMEFINVNFKYTNSENYILKDINLIIEKNKIYGIKGPSGSGKTTLMDIMMGLLKPTEGKIKINDKISLNQNMLKIAYISQKTFLLNDSVLKNITLVDNIEQISLEDLKKALELANIDDFVQNLPGKHLSNVGEDGIKVSGGQRQRIALARSFFFNREIIFLDEPTSALDEKNTEQIMKQLNVLKKTKTIIVSTHSDMVLKYCDAVFHLDTNSK